MQKISGNIIVLIQGLFLVFCLPFLILIFYLFLEKDIEISGKVFLIIITLIILIIIRFIMSYADVYITENEIILKRLIGTRIIKLSQIRKVDEAIMPFTYYIEFINEKKIYFQLKSSDIFKRTAGHSSAQILKSLRQLLKIQST